MIPVARHSSLQCVAGHVGMLRMRVLHYVGCNDIDSDFASEQKLCNACILAFPHELPVAAAAMFLQEHLHCLSIMSFCAANVYMNMLEPCKGSVVDVLSANACCI